MQTQCFAKSSLIRRKQREKNCFEPLRHTPLAYCSLLTHQKKLRKQKKNTVILVTTEARCGISFKNLKYGTKKILPISQQN